MWWKKLGQAFSKHRGVQIRNTKKKIEEKKKNWEKKQAAGEEEEGGERGRRVCAGADPMK